MPSNKGSGMRALITILTYRRHKYLERVLGAAERYLCEPGPCAGRIFVNAVDPDTMAVIDKHRRAFSQVETSKENLRQGPALTALWSDTGADYILHLEDDMVTTRSGWLEPCLDFLDDHPEVGQMRVYPFTAHHVTKTNPITKRPICLDEPKTYGNEKISLMKEPAHFTFIPAITRADAAADLLPLEDTLSIGDRVDAESAARDRFHEAGWATAQLHKGPFKHIGLRSAFGGWGVGMGLHSSSRLGQMRNWCRRRLVAAAKTILVRK